MIPAQLLHLICLNSTFFLQPSGIKSSFFLPSCFGTGIFFQPCIGTNSYNVAERPSKKATARRVKNIMASLKLMMKELFWKTATWPARLPLSIFQSSSYWCQCRPTQFNVGLTPLLFSVGPTAAPRSKMFFLARQIFSQCAFTLLIRCRSSEASRRAAYAFVLASAYKLNRTVSKSALSFFLSHQIPEKLPGRFGDISWDFPSRSLPVLRSLSITQVKKGWRNRETKRLWRIVSHMTLPFSFAFFTVFYTLKGSFMSMMLTKSMHFRVQAAERT